MILSSFSLPIPIYFCLGDYHTLGRYVLCWNMNLHSQEVRIDAAAPQAHNFAFWNHKTIKTRILSTTVSHLLYQRYITFVVPISNINTYEDDFFFSSFYSRRVQPRMGPSGSLLHYILYVFMSLCLYINQNIKEKNGSHRHPGIVYRQCLPPDVPCLWPGQHLLSKTVRGVWHLGRNTVLVSIGIS